MSVLTEFERRGLLDSVSDRDALEQHLQAGSRTVYAGFDPTAASLHIGNLVPLLALCRFVNAGHQAIAVLGGATGLIGDPSGRTEERQFNAVEVVNEWTDRIGGQILALVERNFDGRITIVNNYEWFESISAIEFMRDVGKAFSINVMLRRDSIKGRIERGGLSYTEFSYMLMQARDFYELHQRHACTIQVGGSDQWGNMLSGADLIRRETQETAFVLTFPLVVKADGTKFGKTADGTIWLDPTMTSPYAFYQFWLNTADADVANFLRYFTFDSDDAVAAALAAGVEAPERRVPQRLLAQSVTRLVHGNDGVATAERLTQALFESKFDDLKEADFRQLQQDGLDTVVVSEDTSVVSACATGGLVQSRSAARQLVNSGGLSLNGTKVNDHTDVFDRSVAWFGKYQLLRRGRKAWLLAVHDDG